MPRPNPLYFGPLVFYINFKNRENFYFIFIRSPALISKKNIGINLVNSDSQLIIIILELAPPPVHHYFFREKKLFDTPPPLKKNSGFFTALELITKYIRENIYNTGSEVCRVDIVTSKADTSFDPCLLAARLALRRFKEVS